LNHIFKFFGIFNKQKQKIMKANMGNTDKIIRILAAILIGVLYFMQLISGTVAIVLLVVAAMFIITSFMSFCPLYLPFGLSTVQKEKK